MSIRESSYYWLECDTCTEKSTEGGDFGAWSEVSQAIDEATNGDWWIGDDGQHYCFDHAPRCITCKDMLESDRTCDNEENHDESH
ncbi:hypothetical protein ACFUOZ_05235 [Paenarthrobacter sp. NPDC057355]|uniref:hypothetical protein n=1 Tax=Paenarthrobacter sp. NPDC057355 TaxID=3346105 RepID=UPI0036374F1B